MSHLQPLTSDESGQVAGHIWKALEAIPKHRHNRKTVNDECPTCIAYNHLIKAFKMFKRIGA